MATRRMMDGDSLLKALSVGSCSSVPKQPIEVVVKQQEEEEVCCAAETKSTTLDADKFLGEDCPTLTYDIVNNSDETQTLVLLGGPGEAGDHEVFGEEANASDSPEVTADDGTNGAEPNVIPLQWASIMGKHGGFLVTGFNVSYNTNTTNQNAQKMNFVNMAIDRSKCRRKIVKEICPACPTNPAANGSILGVISEFDACRLTGYRHWFEYKLLPGAAITLEVFYAAYGNDVFNLRPCNGGKVLVAVPAK